MQNLDINDVFTYDVGAAIFTAEGCALTERCPIFAAVAFAFLIGLRPRGGNNGTTWSYFLGWTPTTPQILLLAARGRARRRLLLVISCATCPSNGIPRTARLSDRRISCFGCGWFVIGCSLFGLLLRSVTLGCTHHDSVQTASPMSVVERVRSPLGLSWLKVWLGFGVTLTTGSLHEFVRVTDWLTVFDMLWNL